MYRIPYWINIPLPIVPTISKLTSWIRKIEEAYPIKPHLSTKIYFASTPQQTDIAYLYLHGYSASIHEISPVTEILATHTHSNIIFQRITRHGLSLAPMEYLSPKKWYYSALQGLAIANKLGKKVIVLSCSTGSTLSLLLSARNTAKNEMTHQVCVSPNCWPQPKLTCALFLLPILRNILENAPLIPIIGPHKNQTIRTRHIVSRPTSKLQEENCTLRVPTYAIGNMMQLIKLIWNIRKHSPHSYKIPASIILSDLDKEVLYSMTRKFFKKYMPCSTFDIYNNSTHKKQHVIAGDIYSPHSTLDIVNIICSRLLDIPFLHSSFLQKNASLTH